ncbi:MAG: transposase [Acidobacteria bacterium]|nr:transposase [Acidobacteriota bacterium]
MIKVRLNFITAATYAVRLTLRGTSCHVSQPLFETLFDEQVQIITKVKAKMKNRLFSIFDKLMLRKRAIIESVMDQLKNISQIESNSYCGLKNNTFRSVWRNFLTSAPEILLKQNQRMLS